ncbi:MAG: ABC transporter substrate-binding protein [Acidobacteriota bacterium]
MTARTRLAGLGLCLVVAACRGQAPSPAPAAGAAAASGGGACSVQVGLITTTATPAVQEQMNGMQLARDEVNAAGGLAGCQVDLVIKDDANLPETARGLARELAASPRLLAVFGTNSTASTMAALAVTERAAIPFIVPSVSGGLVTTMGYRWVFRLAAPETALVAALFEFIATLEARLDLRSIAVAYPLTVSGLSMFVAVENQARTQGVSVVAAEEYPPNGGDFRAQLARVRRASPDMVFFDASPPDDAAALMAQARELDLNPKLFLAITGPFVRPGFAKVGEYMIVGSQWTADAPWHDERGQTAPTFEAKYRDRFGVPPNIRAVSTYTSLFVVKRALEQAAGTSVEWSNIPAVRALLRTGLHAVDIPDTLFGPINFDQAGQNAHPVLLAQIQKSAHVLIYPEALRLRSPIVPVPPWKERQ